VDRDYITLECDASDIDDLYRWLVDEPELRPSLQIRRSAPLPGHMGELADILITAVSAGGLLTVLAGSLQGWIRRRGLSVRVRSRDLDVEITADRAEDATELLRQVLNHEPQP